MTTGQGLGGRLLFMVGLVVILALLIKGMRRAHGGGEKGHRVLKHYEAGFFGSLIVAVLLPGALFDVGTAGPLAVATGMTLGLIGRSRSLFRAASLMVAILGLVMVAWHIVRFLLQRRDTPMLETAFNLSVFVLVCACFLIAALVGTLWAALPWGGRLTTHALSFVIVLEMLMLLADPAWDVLHTQGPLQVLASVGGACLVVIVLGLFSYPAVLDLLAVGFAITIAVYGTDLAGPQQHLGIVGIAIALGWLVRSLDLLGPRTG